MIKATASEDPHEELTQARPKGDPELQDPEADLACNVMTSELITPQEYGASLARSDKDDNPDQALALSPKELHPQDQGGYHSVTGPLDSKRATDSKLKGSTKPSGGQLQLGESSRMTAATADLSRTELSSQGTRMRLSNVTDAAPLSPPSQSAPPYRASLFGKTNRQTTAAETDSLDPELGALSASFPAQSVDTRSDVPPMDSLIDDDDESHRQRIENIEEEERKLHMRQVVFCVAFVVLLFGGVGISVILHIKRDKS